MEQLQNKTVKDFMDELASSSPAPGGGSVAGISASIAASLAAMVFNLTVGKKFYNEYDEETQTSIKSSLSNAMELKDEFLRHMDEDVEAFNRVMAAFKLPKESEEEKALRSSAIQEAYVGAMEIPMNLAKRTEAVYDVLEEAARYGNPNAASDAGVGALLCQSALEGAILNVRINLSAIKDKELVERVSRECRELLEKGLQRKNIIMGIVESKL